MFCCLLLKLMPWQARRTYLSLQLHVTFFSSFHFIMHKQLSVFHLRDKTYRHLHVFLAMKVRKVFSCLLHLVLKLVPLKEIWLFTCKKAAGWVHTVVNKNVCFVVCLLHSSSNMVSHCYGGGILRAPLFSLPESLWILQATFDLD